MRRGFTLIEMLLVTAILALAVGALVATLGAGLRSLETAQQFQAFECASLPGLEGLDQDLGRLAPCRDLPFKGDVRSMTFPVELGRPGREDWSPGSIRYAYDPVGRVLLRQQWRRSALEPAAGTGDPVVEQVADCRLSYRRAASGRGSGASWSAEWTDGTNVPDGVRIELQVLRPGNERLVVRRTVAVQVAVPVEETASAAPGGRAP